MPSLNQFLGDKQVGRHARTMLHIRFLGSTSEAVHVHISALQLPGTL